MDTDRIGQLIKFMNIMKDFNASQFDNLLLEMSHQLTLQFMQNLIFSGFYHLLT